VEGDANTLHVKVLRTIEKKRNWGGKTKHKN